MTLNPKIIELDTIIFFKKSFKEFENLVDEVLKNEKFDSENEQKKMYSKYMWIFISHTRDDIKSNIKSKPYKCEYALRFKSVFVFLYFEYVVGKIL